MALSSLWFALLSLAILVLQVHATSVNVNGFLLSEFENTGPGTNNSFSITLQAAPNPNFFFELGLLGGQQPRRDSPIDVTLFQGSTTGVQIASYNNGGVILASTFQTFPTFLNVSRPFTLAVAEGATSWNVVITQDTSSVSWLFPFTAATNARNIFLNGTGQVRASSLNFVPTALEITNQRQIIPVTQFTTGNTATFNLFSGSEVSFGSTVENRNIPLQIHIRDDRIVFLVWDANGVKFVSTEIILPGFDADLAYTLTVTLDQYYWEVQIEQGAYLSPSLLWPIFMNTPTNQVVAITFTDGSDETLVSSVTLS